MCTEASLDALRDATIATWLAIIVGFGSMSRSAFDECLIVVVHGRKLRIERSESDSSGSMRRLTRPGSPPLSPSGAGPLTGTESSDQYRTCRPRRELSVNLSTRSTGVFGSNRYTSSDPNGVSNRSAQYPTGFEVGIQACGSAESSARPLTISCRRTSSKIGNYWPRFRSVRCKPRPS